MVNPKHPCGTCGKSAKTNAVLCGFCDMWHHATPDCMIGCTKEAIDVLIPLCKEQSCWNCKKCSNVMKMLKGQLATLQKDVTSVKNDIKVVKDKQAETDQTVKDLNENVQAMNKKVDGNTGNTKATIMSEVKNREIRKNNVIVLGLNEPPSVQGEPLESRMKKEDATLDEVIAELKLDVGEVRSKIKYRKRLGEKKAGYQRPLLICFRDQAIRESVLSQSAELKDGPMANIRLRPDLTAMEREEDASLRREADTLNVQSPSDDQGDYRWKVVGPPGRLRKVKERDIEKWKLEDSRRKARQPMPSLNNSVPSTAMLSKGIETNQNQQAAAIHSPNRFLPLSDIQEADQTEQEVEQLTSPRPL